MKSVLSLAALCLLVPSASGFGKYVPLVPNGDKVAGNGAIGHVDPSGGGARNAFGKDFAANGAAWNTALCKLDSDGDGATNGEELGDPCCTWTAGAALTSTVTPTSPGTKDTFTTAQLAALKCASTPSGNSTAKPGNATIVTTKPSSSSVTTAPSTTKPAASSATMASVSLTLAVAAAWTVAQ
ncbi:hypothetical protein SPRG_16265 [Saprolegnia parasitica CBS 223.65]|uniref:Temptin Cys/Cys disulfide domain-containing protein n=1 Tax=Saprolegnia parasitica (strain CBS 223.65) TaxID=695850 RepID=A0A067BIV7_SAPPC|nr:hypothetical protein SPRG_16265 [Saprolegnia parasitica CBS 223.65]KDO18349.1 hypothetical protein SPRG_16265 [Saprolegnia parasitica CBS 223.65]|eukprot:XP_012210943.1 hypothetical protein SPRG_16265 [Saprolegnia parasitica CBS 223.65]